MSAHQDKVVAVIDPIWVGHHPMYFAQFVSSFLRHGTRVIALCPDPADARREVMERVGSSIDDRVIFRKLELGERSFFNGRFEGDPLRTALRWKQAATAIEAAEDELGWTADLVYFPYLDTYLRFLPLPVAPEILLGHPWSGLYLRNHHHVERPSFRQKLVLLGKGDAILRSISCMEIGVLDERFIPAMEQHTGKPVRLFPDFTNDVLPEEPSELAKEVLRKAGGRKIIGMIGLERRKGILTLLKTAELARQQSLPCYFVCGGRIFPSEFSREEWQWIESMCDGSMTNLHLDPQAGRIPTEAEFNSLFRTFDIAWAAYENFQGSSNTLGKAAAFEIPCLASETGCVGHRVKTYRSGITIPEADATAALAAIPKLLAIKPQDARYSDFREDHSIARLDLLLGGLLSKLP